MSGRVAGRSPLRSAERSRRRRCRRETREPRPRPPRGEKAAFDDRAADPTGACRAARRSSARRAPRATARRRSDCERAGIRRTEPARAWRLDGAVVMHGWRMHPTAARSRLSTETFGAALGVTRDLRHKTASAMAQSRRAASAAARCADRAQEHRAAHARRRAARPRRPSVGLPRGARPAADGARAGDVDRSGRSSTASSSAAACTTPTARSRCACSSATRTSRSTAGCCASACAPRSRCAGAFVDLDRLGACGWSTPSPMACPGSSSSATATTSSSSCSRPRSPALRDELYDALEAELAPEGDLRAAPLSLARRRGAAPGRGRAGARRRGAGRARGRRGRSRRSSSTSPRRCRPGCSPICARAGARCGSGRTGGAC